MQNVMKINKNY